MIKDAFLLSKEFFKFEEAILSPKEFIKLDDNILDIILTFSLNGENDKKLLEAEKIVKNIYETNYYKIIEEIPISPGINEEPKLDDFLFNENPKDKFYVSEEDIEL